MFGTDLVPIGLVVSEIAVEGVEVESMAAGDERECLIEVIAQFVGVACAAGVIAGDGESTADFVAGVFEAADIIALPALERDGDGGEAAQGAVNIDSRGGVTLHGGGERSLDGAAFELHSNRCVAR